MKEDIKRQWVEALRSGDYQRHKDVYHLRRGDHFSCLGVLCDLAVKAGVVTEVVNEAGFTLYGVEGDRDSEELPRAVLEWAGLTKEPSVYTSVLYDDPAKDPEADDFEVTYLEYWFGFEGVADLIEAQL
ncbi:hypothetical protein AB8O38_11155 [Saccharomonospora xinjiangensis]|uniref:hypothetical protein n=1 Tax=Saccharomonospora xinjiangensis TaxID=75294 RepID=UPI003510750B